MKIEKCKLRAAASCLPPLPSPPSFVHPLLGVGKLEYFLTHFYRRNCQRVKSRCGRRRQASNVFAIWLSLLHYWQFISICYICYILYKPRIYTDTVCAATMKFEHSWRGKLKRIVCRYGKMVSPKQIVAVIASRLRCVRRGEGDREGDTKFKKYLLSY